MPSQSGRKSPAGSPGKARAQRRSPGSESPGDPNDRPGETPLSPGRQSPGPESPSSDAAAAASSPASSRAAASSLLGDGGPAFEGRTLATEPLAGDVADAGAGGPLPIVEQWWTPERAETIAKAQGAVTHALIGVGETDWVWQPAELQAVAGPLASGLNSVDWLRQLAPYADAIGGVMAVAAYAGRSRRERAAVLARQAALIEPEPVSGVDAAGQPSEHEAARRRDVLDRILGGSRRAPATPSTEPIATEPRGPGADLDWRLGE